MTQKVTLRQHSWDGLENPDGTINTNHVVFQQGRTLYEAQVLIGKLERGEELYPQKVADCLMELCFLINGVGYLLAHYNKEVEERVSLVGKLKRLVGTG